MAIPVPSSSKGASGPIRQPKPSKNGPHSERKPSNTHPTVQHGPIRSQAILSSRPKSTGGVTKRGSIRAAKPTTKL